MIVCHLVVVVEWRCMNMARAVVLWWWCCVYMVEVVVGCDCLSFGSSSGGVAVYECG